MKRKKGVRGSLTIEASYVILLTAFTVLMCIVWCMLWHDKTILEEEARRCTAAGARWAVENQNPYNGKTDWDLFQFKGLLWRISGSGADSRELNRLAAENTERNLILCRSPVYSFSLSWRESTGEYRAAAKMPLFSGLFHAAGTVSGRVSVSSTEPEEWIRIARGILFRDNPE